MATGPNWIALVGQVPTHDMQRMQSADMAAEALLVFTCSMAGSRIPPSGQALVQVRQLLQLDAIVIWYVALRPINEAIIPHGQTCAQNPRG